MKTPDVLHLHTYFLFPFVIDKEIAFEGHPQYWAENLDWIDGLDAWIASHGDLQADPVVKHIGRWKRSPYTRFDLDSDAYRDMVFFHPFVRRVFFDSQGIAGFSDNQQEALIRCYTLSIPSDRKVTLFAEDGRGRSSRVQVDEIRLFLLANGVGILSIGVERFNLPLSEALWINEMLRKVYPSSGRQLREGRIPKRYVLEMEKDGERLEVATENFKSGDILRFRPPLSNIVRSLLYFLHYETQEYEQILDERMIVYTHAALDPMGLPEGFAKSEQMKQILSRFLYVDRIGSSFRYDPEFTNLRMRKHLYTRWAHEGTYYGFTSYSNITVCFGVCDRGEHQVKEGALIHRMFDTRYYLMAIVSLFYRATLLSFAEKIALVSRRMYADQESGFISRENAEISGALRAEFLHFSNYWYFEELANKDEEIEHFTMQCKAYRLETLRTVIEQELEKLGVSLYQHNQERSTEAVNRLAMLSMILGAGAVLTGFFGMNFGREFGRLIFEPPASDSWLHYAAIGVVLFLTLGALLLSLRLIIVNWEDYRDILRVNRKRTFGRRWYSLSKTDLPPMDEDEMMDQ
jgi:hypothetical protein